ncbi:hypothetical protein V1514DRAFT_358616 [Lipomyces japonicus]|uniref:uncharacterized protein n=1 Tax=Lipomyces japonicus TaxID=56871 RepID=UPI0034CE7429
MGVHGLWNILSPVARPVKLESLHGKRLAVDASIWIYHFLKAVRDKEGHALPNAHIVGFFRRICKLLFYGILPVFVFDGDAPLIKKQTVANRKAKRQTREEEVSRTASKLLSLQMQKLAEEEVSKPRTQNKDEATPDIVYFDELQMTEEERSKRAASSPKKFRKLDPYHLPEQDMRISGEDPRIMTEDDLERYAREYEEVEQIGLYDTTSIDFSSPEFNSLPINIQYQLLNTARLRSRLRMGYSKEQLDQLFTDRLEFSKFQIARVKERNMLTQKLMNLNGMSEDLSMRVAGERDKAYVLKKNENGWTLALENDSIPKPVIINDDGVEEEDDWEDVPLQKNEKSSHFSHTNMPNVLPGLPFEFVDDLKDDDRLFNISDEESIDLSLHGETSDNEVDDFLDTNDSEFQEAIALSLQPADEIKPSSEQEQPSSKPLFPFIFEDVDSDIATIIDKLPKLPQDQEDEENELKKDDVNNVVPFKPSIRFSLKNSIFGKKRDRTEEVLNDALSYSVKRSMTSIDQAFDRSTASEEEIMILDDHSPSSPNSNIIIEAANSPDSSEPIHEVVNNGFFDLSKENGQISDSNLLLVNKISFSPGYSHVAQAEKITEDAQLNAKSSSPIDITKDSYFESEHVNSLSTAVKSPEMDLTSDSEDMDIKNEIIIPQISESSDELINIAENDDDQKNDIDDERVPDFEDEEDIELVQQIVTEVQEHARFASEINPSASRVDYETEIRNLKNQQRHERRDADQVTLAMIHECQELLSRFGIPYITAPMEAEAQCAELHELGLVDGVVTDDSDIFLFGGTKVYKNMFNQAKYVECYLISDISKELNFNRHNLIELAFLLGSDYTAGLAGVGPVTAEQLIREFKSENTLQDFKGWFERIQRGDLNVDISTSFKKKFKKKNFPEKLVNDAYMYPTVDKDPTAFVWGTPDLDQIRGFLMSTIGWTKERADEVLVPLIKTMNLKKQSITLSKQGFGFRR